ncbi:peptidase M50 [Thermogladius calderae 1633]|uniref:Peptidase M50 n=1 Tax=Thermogladius calderae (strain DSM 22663 / VKM B-2946 / 1633) TaxID=1184251 RepID=I3TCI0_THEC1|nr:site-2 protease family protein [Thermogladius calderae]AFK50468.1 peptidase M50 [Thermogladius calderae 1633]
MNLFSTAGVRVEGYSTYYSPGLGEVADVILVEPLSEELFNRVYRELVKKGYMAVQLKSEKPVFRIIPFSRKRSRWKIPLLLATVVTVFATGLGLSASFYTVTADVVAWSIAYTIIFIVALAVHEFGHILASRRSGVLIEGPFFIPAPPIQLGFIGTFGAVINMKTIPPDKKSLSQIGISGPLFGFLAGLVIAPFGILLSQPLTVQQAQSMVEAGLASPLAGVPLVFQVLEYFMVPQGYTILVHPLAFISYIVFLVTFLNLIPIGQLDGGYVLRSYLSPSLYDLVGWASIALLMTLGIFYGIYLWIGIIALLFKLLFGRYQHPGSANQYSESHNFIYLALYLVLLALTAPIP